jgi:predicted RNA-binding protein Jag
MSDANQPIVDFLNRVTAALGIRTPIDVEDTPDGLRLNLSGDEAELLVRHRGEPLKALQHVVDMAYGRSLGDERRVFVDALAYRKGKDV